MSKPDTTLGALVQDLKGKQSEVARRISLRTHTDMLQILSTMPMFSKRGSPAKAQIASE